MSEPTPQAHGPTSEPPPRASQPTSEPSPQAPQPTSEPTHEPARPPSLRRHRARYHSTTFHVCGIALSFVSAGMLACALLELLTTNRDTAALAVSGAAVAAAGIGAWYFTAPGAVSNRDVFSAVGWTWAATTLVGALPFLAAGTFAAGGAGLAAQIVDSLFESTSGFTASGSTVLADFDRPGRGMLMYRQAAQWYGGMGVVLLAVTVLPFLGVGGLELVSAEAPGPSSDRLTPRVSQTVRRLWAVYAGFTLAVALALFAVPGPGLYDSVAHALTAASTGGFSPHPDSIGHFGSLAVEAVVIVAMVAGAVSFTLHWRALAGHPAYHRDSELRAFGFVLAAATAAIVGLLWLEGGLGLAESARAGLFTAVSLGTSTGFTNASGPGAAADYVAWVGGAQMVLLFVMVVGGCSGSTSGGIKVMRMQVLGVVMVRSVRRAQMPRAIIPVKLGDRVLAEGVVARVVGFFLLHLMLVMVGLVAVTALGGDFETSLGSVVSALSNMGPALGEAGPTANFAAAFSLPARLVLTVLMLIGRLEIVPILLMFAAGWQRLSDPPKPR